MTKDTFQQPKAHVGEYDLGLTYDELEAVLDMVLWGSDNTGPSHTAYLKVAALLRDIDEDDSPVR